MDEDVEEAERQVTKAEEAEQTEADAKLALEKALAGIKAPTTVPVSTMQNPEAVDDAKMDAGARKKLMLDALQKKRDAAAAAKQGSGSLDSSQADAHEEGEPFIGMQAVMSSLRRTGALKAKVKKSKEGKKQVVADVLKLGKHLLK